MSFEVSGITHFSLDKIADSGQAFRWIEDGKAWKVPVAGKAVRLIEDG